MISDEHPMFGRPKSLLHLEEKNRRLVPGFGLADQDFDKVFRVEFRVISVVSNCVHHILEQEA